MRFYSKTQDKDHIVHYTARPSEPQMLSSFLHYILTTTLWVQNRTHEKVELGSAAILVKGYIRITLLITIICHRYYCDYDYYCRTSCVRDLRNSITENTLLKF